jgi:effector-binding domain-containing protein
MSTNTNPQHMHYEIQLTRSDLVHTAVIRDRVRPQDLPRFVPAACGEVWKFIRAAGLTRPGRHMALYLSDGTVEVGAEVSEPFEGNGRVHCSHLPAGDTATTVHFGPYTQLSKAHETVRKWCAEHQHNPSDICWEVYGHWEEAWNAEPSKIRTDVFYLLRDSNE